MRNSIMTAISFGGRKPHEKAFQMANFSFQKTKKSAHHAQMKSPYHRVHHLAEGRGKCQANQTNHRLSGRQDFPLNHHQDNHQPGKGSGELQGVIHLAILRQFPSPPKAASRFACRAHLQSDRGAFPWVYSGADCRSSGCPSPGGPPLPDRGIITRRKCAHPRQGPRAGPSLSG